ncbi:hypothetical protein, partial [Xanthomonas oryzae]|uniref:hypothetical protein n=1 Tax=Xanthomonas oryzae TaxID=347 RepID=UPI002DF3FD59|nr:hypothetical protein [Xanthomonas oryzae pv. oryzicola]
MTDADAADMASHKGIKTQAALWAMGTGTRREANGHGQYRRLFDRSWSPLKNPQTASIARPHLRFWRAGTASFHYSTYWFLAVFAH